MFDEKKIIGEAEVSKTESGFYIVKKDIYIPEVKPFILTEKGGIII